MTQEKEYPFIFINHGKPIDIYSFQGEKYFIFSFKENINKAVSKKVEKLTPKIFDGSFLWSENMMMNYSITEEDEIIMYYMKKRKQGFDADMDDDLMEELFTDLANDIESWAVKVNNISPIDFFIGHPRISGSYWDKFSNSQLQNVIFKLESECNELNPRKKQIINESFQQLKQSKSMVLTKEQLKKVNELIKLTE